NFARTIGGTCGKEATQIGAGSQENQSREEHQSRNECLHSSVKAATGEACTLQAKAHLRIVFGIALFESGANRVQVGNRLRRSDSRLQMPKRLTDPTVSAGVQKIRRVVVFLVDDGYKEIGREDQNSPAESGRRYTDDGKRMLVEMENAADHAAVILKMAVPIRIGKDDIWSMLIGGVNEPAKIRLNA